jgi:hypothetical protein
MFKKLFGKADSTRRGVSLDRLRAWELTAPADQERIAAALETLLPQGSVVVLETTSFDPEVAKILRHYEVPAGIEIRAGILWPRSKMLHVGATRDSLKALHDLVTTLPAPQVCDHLYAYAGKDLLLEWTDVFDDPIYLSPSLPEVTVTEFCNTLRVAINRRPSAV